MRSLRAVSIPCLTTRRFNVTDFAMLKFLSGHSGFVAWNTINTNVMPARDEETIHGSLNVLILRGLVEEHFNLKFAFCGTGLKIQVNEGPSYRITELGKKFLER